MFLAFLLEHNMKDHQKSIHATKKDWVCDCCGSCFGVKRGLKQHMMKHLPPSFACLKCDGKFVYAGTLKTHLKLHAGVLSEFCKLCNKGFSIKMALRNHIINSHFTKIPCEITNCLYQSSSKPNHKRHFRKVHRNIDQILTTEIFEKLDKLKPDFQMMKYV